MFDTGIDEALLKKALIDGPALSDDIPNEELVEAALDVVGGRAQLKDIKGLTDEEMEASYANGYSVFRAGNYHKAEDIFMFLCTMDNCEKKYWTALGAARFNMGNHYGALLAYSQAALLDIEPALMIKVAQCRLALGDKELAEGCLDAAVELAGDAPDHAQDKARAEAMLSLLQSPS